MKGYIFEVRESDGNDCTVYDYITEAKSAEVAREELGALLDSKAKAGEWEPDGNFGGYYFPCDCENEEPEEPAIPCDSCQMLMINGVACHETGCPKESAYRRALRQYERFECQGHGGLTVSEELYEFESLDAAEEEHSKNRYYHSTL